MINILGANPLEIPNNKTTLNYFDCLRKPKIVIPNVDLNVTMTGSVDYYLHQNDKFEDFDINFKNFNKIVSINGLPATSILNGTMNFRTTLDKRKEYWTSDSISINTTMTPKPDFTYKINMLAKNVKIEWDFGSVYDTRNGSFEISPLLGKYKNILVKQETLKPFAYFLGNVGDANLNNIVAGFNLNIDDGVEKISTKNESLYAIYDTTGVKVQLDRNNDNCVDAEIYLTRKEVNSLFQSAGTPDGIVDSKKLILIKDTCKPTPTNNNPSTENPSTPSGMVTNTVGSESSDITITYSAPASLYPSNGGLYDHPAIACAANYARNAENNFQLFKIPDSFVPSGETDKEAACRRVNTSWQEYIRRSNSSIESCKPLPFKDITITINHKGGGAQYKTTYSEQNPIIWDKVKTMVAQSYQADVDLCNK
jgi:hypothetical protein